MSAMATPFAAAAQAFPSTYPDASPSTEELVYAPMRDRFLAFLCDVSVETLLIGAFLALTYAQSSLGFEVLKKILVWVIPTVYMTLSEFLFHRTLGKWLLRIQLRAESDEHTYPRFSDILLRESVGKFVSGFVLGIGFLVGIGSSRKRTWADVMGQTVVVKTGNLSSAAKLLLVPLLIVANVGLALALDEMPRIYKRNIADRLTTIEEKIEDLHVRIFSLFLAAPKSPAAYQQTMTKLASMLDDYDQLLAKEPELIAELHKFAATKDPIEDLRAASYGFVIPIRQEFSQLLRKHAQSVLAFDPQRQNWDAILQERLETKRAMIGKNAQMNRAGKPFLRRTVAIEGHED
jgi:uncharacterized RDD family membrane protein YckC